MLNVSVLGVSSFLIDLGLFFTENVVGFSVAPEIRGYLTLRCSLKLAPRVHSIRASFCPLLSLEKGEFIGIHFFCLGDLYVHENKWCFSEWEDQFMGRQCVFPISTLVRWLIGHCSCIFKAFSWKRNVMCVFWRMLIVLLSVCCHCDYLCSRVTDSHFSIQNLLISVKEYLFGMLLCIFPDIAAHSLTLSL